MFLFILPTPPPPPAPPLPDFLFEPSSHSSHRHYRKPHHNVKACGQLKPLLLYFPCLKILLLRGSGTDYILTCVLRRRSFFLSCGFFKMQSALYLVFSRKNNCTKMVVKEVWRGLVLVCVCVCLKHSDVPVRSFFQLSRVFVFIFFLFAKALKADVGNSTWTPVVFIIHTHTHCMCL